MTRAGMLRHRHVRRVPEAGRWAVITMGGGYSRPFDASVDAHADVYRRTPRTDCFASPLGDLQQEGAGRPRHADEGEDAGEEQTEEVAEEEIEKVVADVNADEAKFTDKTKPPKEANVKSDKFTTQIAAQIAALKSEKAQEMTTMTVSRPVGQAGGGSIQTGSTLRRRLVRRSARGGPDARWRAP